MRMTSAWVAAGYSWKGRLKLKADREAGDGAGPRPDDFTGAPISSRA